MAMRFLQRKTKFVILAAKKELANRLFTLGHRWPVADQRNDLLFRKQTPKKIDIHFPVY